MRKILTVLCEETTGDILYYVTLMNKTSNMSALVKRDSSEDGKYVIEIFEDSED